jgi:hypothetical protein
MQIHYDASSMNPLKLCLLKEKDQRRRQYYREKQQNFIKKTKPRVVE